MKSYQKEVTDQETGEIVTVAKYKYVTGSPKQYRFNGQNGQFNINGDQILLDSKGKAIDSFSFQPIAWRIFKENLFGRTKKDENGIERPSIDLWAELFFVDEKNCISSIIFNNTTVQELMGLSTSLFYDDITLADVILTIKTRKAESKNGSWVVGQFSYQLADKAKVSEFKEFSKDFALYRHDTLTDTSVYLAKSENFTALPPKEAAIQIENE